MLRRSTSHFGHDRSHILPSVTMSAGWRRSLTNGNMVVSVGIWIHPHIWPQSTLVVNFNDSVKNWLILKTPCMVQNLRHVSYAIRVKARNSNTSILVVYFRRRAGFTYGQTVDESFLQTQPVHQLFVQSFVFFFTCISAVETGNFAVICWRCKRATSCQFLSCVVFSRYSTAVLMGVLCLRLNESGLSYYIAGLVIVPQ